MREKFTPLYTLKDEDHEVEGVVYKSARNIYLAQRDPTEYEAAQVLFGSWRHWKFMVKSCKWFRIKVEEWRDELEVQLRSEAIREIVADTTSTKSRSSISSAKWLADSGWKTEDGRGRPSKKAVAKEAKIQGRMAEELEEDIERMQEFH